MLRFQEIDRRMKSIERIWETLNTIQKDVANLNGRMAGYLLAGGVLGAALGFVAQLALKK
jgi:hypothetical protein